MDSSGTGNPPTGRGANASGRRGASGDRRQQRGRGYWRPYRGRFGGASTGPREKPVGFALPNEDFAVGSEANGSNLRPLLSFMLETEPCEYAGWKLYLPEEGFREGSSTLHKIRTAERHFNACHERYDFEFIKENFWFELNLGVCEADDVIATGWPTFRQDLADSPEHTLACCGLAMHQVITKAQPPDMASGSKLLLQTIRPRVVGYGPEVPLRLMKVNSFGKLISVRGTIIRASASQILNSWCAFRCRLCRSQQAVRQNEGVYTMPTSCRGACKAKSHFVPLLGSVFTRTEAFQTVRLQESMLGAQSEHGHVPRNIEVELSHELVDSVCPGDDVTVTGILKVRPQDESSSRARSSRARSSASMYKVYMQAVAVRSNKNVLASWHRMSEFTDLDMEAIRLIQAEPSPFRLLVHSLCPSIYGHEMIKAGLLLGMFGGHALSGRTRSEIHVLVVGDPGIGKSQMLQCCANVSPRGIFVCGNSTSNAGLTVTVRTEKGSGGSLEAGALVLADQGVCCIDEFDKMSGNHQILLEVMEQQVVSVAKAGVICKLPARTSVLAAANPAGGHYDKSKTVSENLKMNPALLSRFDLVFILLDRPNEHLDNMLTAHIQNAYGLSGMAKAGSGTAGGHPLLDTSVGGDNSGSSQCEAPLPKRLKLIAGENLDLLPQELIQKYIGYARKHVQPRLTKDAALAIRAFYLELRRAHHGMETIPVTTRQLEALVRLTQARARVDLSAVGTLAHAQDVIAILRHSMVDVFSNDAGDLQLTRLMNGTGTSQSSVVRKFIRVLQQRSSALGKTVFTVDELRQVATTGGIVTNFHQLLDTLNIQGFLLKKGHNCYKFMID